MEIKYQFEIVDQHQNSKKPLIDGNKKWVAVDSISAYEITEILLSVYWRSEARNKIKDTLWFDDNETLFEALGREISEKLKTDNRR